MGWKVTRDPADDAFSQWIRLRDKECRRCHSKVRFNGKGLPVSHQASHYKGRRKENSRFDPDNVDTLCGGCHGFFTENPNLHDEWQIRVKGQDKVDEIILRSNFYKKRDRMAELIYWRAKLKQDFGVPK